MNDGLTVARNTLFLTIGSIAQKLLSFVYFTLLARFFLSQEDMGKYLYALSFATLFSVIVDFGFQPAVIREIARARNRTTEIVSNVLGIKLLLGAATACAMLISARAIESDPVRIGLISLATIVIILDSAHLTFYAVLRGYERLRYEAFGLLIGQALIISTGIALILFRAPLPLLMLAFVGGSAWNTLYSWRAAARVSGARFTFSWDWTLWHRLVRLALPFAIAGVFVRIYASADSVLLGRMLTDADVALYGVPNKFVFAFQFVPIALSAALFPALSREFPGDRTRAGALFAQSQRYLLLIVVPLSVGLIVLAKPIIGLFYGEQYLAASLVLQLLAMSLIPAFLDFPVGAMLNAAHRQNTQTALMGLVMVINIGLNLLLIPHLGAIGAAAAVIVGNAVLLVGGIAFIPGLVPVPWRALGMSAARILTATSLMGALVLAVVGRAPLALTVLFGVLTYVGALFVMREIGRRDVERIRDLLRPGVGPIGGVSAGTGPAV